MIFVLDTTQFGLAYLERCHEILSHLLGTPGSCCEKLLVLLNKQDLIGLEQLRVIEKRLKLNEMQVEWLVMPTSAKNGYGISEAVNWLLM